MSVPNWLEAIILGIVQGLTEFIPVSSSGHLVLVPFLFSWERPGLAFDVALHVGTALAVVAFFRKEVWAMITGVLRGAKTAEGRLYRMLAFWIVLGSVPVGITGLLLKDFFEDAFATPRVAATFLFVTAGLLISGEAFRRTRIRRAAHASVPDAVENEPYPPAESSEAHLPTGHDADDPTGVTVPQIRLKHALLIGLAQAMALFPGISRSGITITAGIAAGLTREAATRFSFLLSLPALAGAAVLSLPDLAAPDVYSPPEILGGVVAAFISGYLAIRFLVDAVARYGLRGFAVYCVGAGLVGWAASFVLT